MQVNQMRQLLSRSKFNDIKGIKILPTFDLQGITTMFTITKYSI